MTTLTAQDYLFQCIKGILPADVSLVEKISEILHVSMDSAYRRLRGDTPLVLDEVSQLCSHFNISLDQLLNVKKSSILFENVTVGVVNNEYEKFLNDLLQKLKIISSFHQKKVIYLSKDIPFFHNFYFKPVISFRYFFWMKTIIGHPDFSRQTFDFNCISPEIERLSKEVLVTYQQVPSIEMWNTESINSVISQIEFYKDSGYFTSASDIRIIYESLEESLMHIKHQVDLGAKFLPSENPSIKKSNFSFFFNRVVLGDNTVLVVTDHSKTAYLNYGMLNYLVTNDQIFCEQLYADFENLKKRSTMLSHSSERQRNIFFGILLGKIKDRKKHL